MQRIKDRVTLGIVSGLAGAVAKDLINEAMVRLGWSAVRDLRVASGIFVPRPKTKTSWGTILGVTAQSSMAAACGVATTYLLSLTGRDKYLLKGAGLGAALWISAYGIVTNLGTARRVPKDPVSNLLIGLSHMAYGLTTAAVAAHLGDPRLFTGLIPLTPRASAFLEAKNPSLVQLVRKQVAK